MNLQASYASFVGILKKMYQVLKKCRLYYDFKLADTTYT